MNYALCSLGMEGTSPMEAERPREMNKIPKDIFVLKIDDTVTVITVFFYSLMCDFLSMDLTFLSRQWHVIAY